jgi:predicted secreted Zn-dependent protease
MRSILSFGLFLFCLSSSVFAALDVKTEFDYYDIEGHSARDLRRSMRTQAIKEKGKKFDARTDWNVKWNYRYEPRGADCKVTSMQTSLAVHYLMPRWKGRDQASEKLKQQWDRFYAALLLHEEGHGTIGRRAAEEIDTALQDLGRGLRCSELNTRIQETAKGILEKYREEERNYDKKTRHGKTQGAIFP